MRKITKLQNSKEVNKEKKSTRRKGSQQLSPNSILAIRRYMAMGADSIVRYLKDLIWVRVGDLDVIFL
ncbi:hypothetical protein FRX31_024064 [Thalictrum thalictroides]|uniref:Uncharacterized protein n=1 Tax=Thalictrum thalictroides TaxID=46969 RepID=A0A7J6VP62_THATH|nr:hypothetical protein FRX31_024064 [Thalictrum thalictroides]